MSIAEKFEVIADEVYEKGKKDEYDKFWDNFQNYGNRTNYDYGFVGYSFNFDNFYPKYDIKPTGYRTNVFYAWNNSATGLDRNKFIGSLKQRLEECDVVLDTSGMTYMGNIFTNGCWTELPTIDMTGLTSASPSIFANNYGTLTTIEKIIIAETTPISTNWFGSNCHNLKNLVIEGKIGKNNFNVQWQTKLSGASIVSIIEALSTTTSGLTVTLSQTAVDNMTFPITSIRKDADGNEYTTTYNSWIDLAGDGIDGSGNLGIRPNWNISLV